METPPSNTHRTCKKTTTQKTPEKYTDGDMATSIITVQKILTGQRAADTEDRFAVIVRAV
jgi:hypothetical protein